MNALASAIGFCESVNGPSNTRQQQDYVLVTRGERTIHDGP